MSGLVINQCVLTLTTPGVLAPASTGTTLGSDQTGGVPAVLSVVAVGTNPTINFTAPALTAPGGAPPGTTQQISYTSPGGANQAWTSSSSIYTMNRLLDTVTIHGRAQNGSGFASGTYAVATTATCQQ